MENDSRFRLLLSSIEPLCPPPTRDNWQRLHYCRLWSSRNSNFKQFDLDKIAQKSVRRFLLCPQDELDKKYQILMDFPTLSALKRISATTWKHFYPKIFLVSKIIFVVVTEIFAYSTSKRAISSTANQNRALTPDFFIHFHDICPIHLWIFSQTNPNRGKDGSCT